MRASERRPEGQRCSGSRDGEGEATGATRGARGKSCFKTGQNSRHPPCFCALLVSDPIRCLHIVQNWAPPSWKASGRPVWVLRLVLLRSNLTCDLVFVLLQKEKSKKKKTGQAKVATRRQSAAAAAAASITTDKLGELEGWVDIVASFLALNHEARSVDDSVPGWLSVLSGTIPMEFGQLRSLSSLYLSDNVRLSGTVPDFVAAVQLQILDLKNCSLTGLPATLPFSLNHVYLELRSLIKLKMACSHDLRTATGHINASIARRSK